MRYRTEGELTTVRFCWYLIAFNDNVKIKQIFCYYNKRRLDSVISESINYTTNKKLPLALWQPSFLLYNVFLKSYQTWCPLQDTFKLSSHPLNFQLLQDMPNFSESLFPHNRQFWNLLFGYLFTTESFI